MYNAGDLLARLQAKPFQPFTLEMSNGESYSISHPEQCVVTTGDTLIVLSAVEGGRHRLDYYGLDHLVRFHDESAAS